MKITSKGQVTIPQTVRDRCALLPGTEIDFTVRGDEVVISKRDQSETRIEGWLQDLIGSADAGLTTDEIMEMTRGEN